MQKICPYPFSRIEINPQYYIPCCYDWLTKEYTELSHEGVDKWNSPAALELRKRILNGDFSLCKREYCKVELVPLDKKHVESSDYIVDQARLQTIKNGDFESLGPTSVSITADRRCNLACESCRPEKVSRLSEKEEKNLNQTVAQINKHAHDIKAIKMVGDGEVFYSPFLSKFLKQLNPNDYPALEKVFLLTNGTLFTKNAYERLMPGINYVDTVSVSIDAGTKQCYKEVRGGDWDQLISNLHFISSLRKEKKIGRFVITFVTRVKNYETIPDFVELGKKLGVDNVEFSAFHPWANMSPLVNYKEQAIHLKKHPDHHKLTAILDKVTTNNSKLVNVQF
jgi:wyosine [tRNA(Phe)-imidazoG37] synthetase (radical SAM superfamily)